MKYQCKLCKKYHKGGAGAHIQTCRVCGKDKQTVDRVEDVNPQHLCLDEETHRQIIQGFGDDTLVLENPAVVHRKAKKPSKLQVTWL